MTQNTNSMDQLQDRRDLPVFIHSELDDMGLSPNAFRLYCHLARRAGAGVAWPSYQSMGDVCFAAIAEGRSRRNIAMRAMTELVERGLISKQARTNDDGNQTNLYYLTPRREWTPSIVGMPGEHSGNATPSIVGMPKGTPSEGTPSKDVVVVEGRTLADVFRTWSQITKGTFNSIDSDKVKDLIDTHGAEAVYQAMLDANEQGKRTLAYVNGILRNRQNGTEKPQPQQQRQGSGRRLSKVEESLAAVDRVMAMAERGELDEWLK